MIIGAGRTGSSLLSAVLAAAGGDYGMPADQAWEPDGGAFEQSAVTRAAAWFAVAGRLGAAQPIWPRRWVWDGARHRAKAHLRRALAAAQFVKGPNLDLVAQLTPKLGYRPRIVVSHRAFAAQAMSHALRSTNVNAVALEAHYLPPDESAMQRPIFIDTDPGIDDAVAILLALAAPELAVQALVAVAGNVPLAATARNARAVVELAGRRDIPVFAGCPRPLAGGALNAAQVHGDDGLGRLVLPPPDLPLQAQHGVISLIEALRAAPPHSTTLCALGPLTNIAVALVMAPDIAAAIAELVVMGGGTHGNITPAAEFNIHCDPQAAAIVFASGLPITLVPLDVTEQAIGTPERIAPIAALGTRCGAAAATLLGPAAPGRPPVAMHDACVIAWLLAPELFQVSEAHVAVETGSPLTLGMTVIDRRGRGRSPNARIIDRVDADGLFRLLATRLANLP